MAGIQQMVYFNSLNDMTARYKDNELTQVLIGIFTLNLKHPQTRPKTL